MITDCYHVVTISCVVSISNKKVVNTKQERQNVCTRVWFSRKLYRLARFGN